MTPKAHTAAFLRVLLLALIAQLPTAARCEQPLRWKFVKGATNDYQLRQNMIMKMITPDGKEEPTVMNQTIDMQWVVDEVRPDGSALVSQHVRRMQMTMTGQGGVNSTFDTDSKTPPQGFAAMVAPLLQAMTKGAFQTTMTARGEITDVKVPEEIMTAIKSSPGAAMMGDMASPEGFKKMLSQASLVLPETLAKGQEWTTEMEVKNPAFGVQRVKTTYRYEGSEEKDGQVLEVFTPTMSMSFDNKAAAGLASVEVTGQQSTGKVVFNRTLGRMESTDIKQGLDMVVSVAGQKITQKLDQTMEYGIAPKKSAEKPTAEPAK
jgi:hypothetical protein